MEEQFAAVTESYSANDRRYPRYQTPLPVSIGVREECLQNGNESLCDGQEAFETESLQNISLTGLYFTSLRAYAVNSHLAVKIALGGRQYQIRVLVQRCIRLENCDIPTYGVAVLFVRGAEIHPFLADLATFLNKSDLSAL